MKSCLIVLDGFGIGKDTPFNAIANAKMPFYRNLLARYPHSQLMTHGEAVGLPDGVMGNSEVGHMTMGAGRIVYQDLTKISKAIRDRDFFSNSVLRKAILAGANATGRVHLMGLISDGGVHSHIDHIMALLDLCCELHVPEISVHLFTDGRDTPPQSSTGYVELLFRHPAFATDATVTRATVASVGGRYYAMDRDKRWERVAKGYLAMTGQIPVASGIEGLSNRQAILQVIEKSHQAGTTDEFIEPTLIDAQAAMKSGDSVIFFNFRSDRAREISLALTAVSFNDFVRGKAPVFSSFACMTTYDVNLGLPVAFGPQNLTHIMGQCLEEAGLAQLRIAETEKYAHVTFFFNGGREKPFEREDRILIPSPKDVATYDLKPEMSAFAVAEAAADRLLGGHYDFTLMNFANADMVGHTGNYAAAVKAVETLDQCLERVCGAAEKSGTHVLLTADHGNAEEMVDCNGHPHTQHTLNPVPAVWIAPGTANAPKSSRVALKDGTLADVMPTLLNLMQLPFPVELTGKTLLPDGFKQ